MYTILTLNGCYCKKYLRFVSIFAYSNQHSKTNNYKEASKVVKGAPHIVDDAVTPVPHVVPVVVLLVLGEIEEPILDCCDGKQVKVCHACYEHVEGLSV